MECPDCSDLFVFVSVNVQFYRIQNTEFISDNKDTNRARRAPPRGRLDYESAGD